MNYLGTDPNQPNPTLWKAHSPRQVYLTALERISPRSGPAITFTGLVPDLDHFHGRGGRVHPLWRDRAATDPEPNIKPALLAYLGKIYGTIKAEDMMGYLAAVMAHPGFTARFKSDLLRPGLRVPLTADAKLFAEAVALGREVVWLHSYGERFIDPVAGRPKQAPRLPKDSAPSIPKAGAIPSAPEPLPDTMDYDPAARRLKIGKGYIENVTPEMWGYEVSGKQVLWQWFSYRRRDRTKPPMGDKRPPSPLEQIVPDAWLPEYTTDLLDLLHVLGRLIALEHKQADVLRRICDSRLLSTDELRSEGALVAPSENSEAQKGKGKSKA
jgi:Type ISP C-terminal specificity domain